MCTRACLSANMKRTDHPGKIQFLAKLRDEASGVSDQRRTLTLLMSRIRCIRPCLSGPPGHWSCILCTHCVSKGQSSWLKLAHIGETLFWSEISHFWFSIPNILWNVFVNLSLRLDMVLNHEKSKTLWSPRRTEPPLDQLSGWLRGVTLIQLTMGLLSCK